MNEQLLRSMGVRSVLGGEFEQGLVDLADRMDRPHPLISLDRLHFITPDRSQLATLCCYATLLLNGVTKRVGSTEASRAASISAATARWFLSTTEHFVWFSATWCSATFASRSQWAPNTSPSAIRTSSMARVTPWRSWTRFTPSFPP
jgi:hypothetical protein